MIYRLLDSLAEQINIKVSASETVNVVVGRFQFRELLPLLLGRELLVLALG
jgi:hypothetical protein